MNNILDTPEIRAELERLAKAEADARWATMTEKERKMQRLIDGIFGPHKFYIASVEPKP